MLADLANICDNPAASCKSCFRAAFFVKVTLCRWAAEHFCVLGVSEQGNRLAQSDVFISISAVACLKFKLAGERWVSLAATPTTTSTKLDKTLDLVGFKSGSAGSLTPQKKMKKRKELNALIGLGDSKRKKTKKGSGHRLLRTEPPDSESDSSSDDDEFNNLSGGANFGKWVLWEKI